MAYRSSVYFKVHSSIAGELVILLKDNRWRPVNLAEGKEYLYVTLHYVEWNSNNKCVQAIEDFIKKNIDLILAIREGESLNDIEKLGSKEMEFPSLYMSLLDKYPAENDCPRLRNSHPELFL
jgi:hypothetical protein